jgi:phage terminase small subunit
MPLSDKQVRFCEEYLIDLNGSQAVIRAGYSKTGSNVTAVRLLANPNIAKKITELQQKRSKRTAVTSDRVIEELERIAFAQTPDFIKIKDIIIGRGRRAKSKRVAIAELTNDIPIEKLAALSEIRQTQHGIVIKLHDKVRALELLGKHTGAIKERHEHTGKNGAAIEMNVNKITHNLVVKRCDK